MNKKQEKNTISKPVVKISDGQPIVCPITECQKLFFASQFARHIYDSHINVPVELLTPGKPKKVYLNFTDQQPLGLNKCAILYLVKGKLSDGSSHLSEYFPVALMSTQIGIGQLLSEDWIVKDDEPKVVLIWCTGIQSENHDNSFNLSLNGNAKTGKLYQANMNQNFRTIYDSGMGLMLTEDDLNNSTDGDGETILNLQVTIY